MKRELPVRPWFGIFALTLVACLTGQPAVADIEGLGDDGWYTWRVAASERAPDWCCFSWSGGVVTDCGCDLDEENTGFGSTDESTYKPLEMHLFVLMENGQARQIRAVSPSCPVTTKKPLVDLGLVASQVSADWISNEIRMGYNDSDEAFAALSVHSGDAGFVALSSFVEDRGSDEKMRKKALFWLAHSDSDQAFAYLEDILTP